MLSPRIVIALLASALAAGALAVPAGAGTKLPGLPTEMGPGYHVRPAEIDYTGDGSGVLGGFDGHGHGHYGHLHWRFWTGQDAAGSGAVSINDCTPFCAAGTFHPFSVKVFAFRPRSGHFTRLTLRYRYHGKNVVDRRTVVKFGYGIA